MTDNACTVTFSCDKCGGELATAEDNPTDDSIVTCTSCGEVIGTLGQVNAEGLKAAEAEFVIATQSMLEDAFKGVKGVKFTKS